MSIYGFATKTVTPTPIANDALAPDFTVYCRTTETGVQQLNNKINPQIHDEEWVDIPNRVYQVLINPESTLTVGKLAAHYATEAIQANKWMQLHDEAKEQARRAISIIGERLIQESNDRDWCSEFDNIIETVNGQLPSWLELPVRKREYEVTWSEEYTITVHRSATVTARDEQDAIDIVEDWDEADSYEISEAVNRGDWSYVSDNGDFQAEEV
jgi:hypothetical protein